MLLYSFHLAAIFIILCKIGLSIVTSDTLNRPRLFIFTCLKRLETDIVTLPFLQVYWRSIYSELTSLSDIFVLWTVLFFKWQKSFTCWHVKWDQAIFDKPKKYRQDFFNSLRSRHRNTTPSVLTVQTVPMQKYNCCYSCSFC